MFHLAPSDVELVALARAVAETFATGSVPIQVEAAAEEVCVVADPARTRQVLENLVSNAVVHSPPGEPVVIAIGYADDGSGRKASVDVINGGPGIAPDVLPRLFNRFSRGPESTGLGLGLFLARSIAEAHGGMLTAESQHGRGARFRLTLPA